MRDRIELLTLDFARFDANLSGRGRFSRAVFRRLFLDEILPARFERIVSINSDMLIVRPGLEKLESFDLGGRPLAAAYDMIFLMDFKGDALARRFQRSRRALGLSLDTPYFNAGLIAIDRAAWRAERVTERATEALRDDPKRFPFMEQDALNATLRGDFAPLSPRFNFMGDFFLLDLEHWLEPIVLHFVNAPKPWELALWRGEGRFAENYRDWFRTSPWPELAQAPAPPPWRRTRPPLTRPASGLREAPVGIPCSDALHRWNFAVRSSAQGRLNERLGASDELEDDAFGSLRWRAAASRSCRP